jgi:hypothetical protein
LNQPKSKSNYELPKQLPTSFTEEVALFYDLMKLALQTDSTRVISMAIYGWTGDSGLSGVTKGYHDLSHHDANSSNARIQDPERIRRPSPNEPRKLKSKFRSPPVMD